MRKDAVEKNLNPKNGLDPKPYSGFDVFSTSIDTKEPQGMIPGIQPPKPETL